MIAFQESMQVVSVFHKDFESERGESESGGAVEKVRPFSK